MEKRALKNVNNCLNTNVYSYLETPGGESSNLYYTIVYFFMHLLHLKTVVLLHWCLICGVLLEGHALKNVNNCLNTNIYSYLETPGGESSNLYLNFVYFTSISVN